ncbi:unnamed protein product [Brugia timori]|uniref:Secreted protein n=1 Tax=Brugia timori TaxID=42155 RepID=A0A0R3R9F2_9BILA|nr:unnamed protein product [Brugia timori]
MLAVLTVCGTSKCLGIALEPLSQAFTRNVLGWGRPRATSFPLMRLVRWSGCCAEFGADGAPQTRARMQARDLSATYLARRGSEHAMDVDSRKLTG